MRNESNTDAEKAVASDRAPRPAGRRGELAALFVMLLGVLAVYWPPAGADGSRSILGLDFENLHVRRIRFAQEALFYHGTLPAWYPRELLGTPFWSNVQSFPFIPTRLPLLLFAPEQGMMLGTLFAALLAAGFTYGFCRSVGVGRVGAAVAGWTFACSGYFAARVLAGHLPYLEAYPALPLLLWVIERTLQVAPEDRRRFAVRLLVVGLCTTAVMLAGHPQLVVYSMVIGALYVLRRARDRRILWLAGAMGLGVGASMFSLWPMLKLIGRSTRVLALDAPDNDVAFPLARLVALVFPWAQGWSSAVDRRPHVPVVFGRDEVFWDTVAYVGWLPLLALALTLVIAIARRRSPARPWGFLMLAGVLALLLALPAVRTVVNQIPGTFLRSPSRQVYITVFALAFATGYGVDALLRLAARDVAARRPRGTWAYVGVCVALLAHFVDLRVHDRHFIRPRMPTAFEVDEAALRQLVGNGRVAFDITLWFGLNRQFDDVGFFDSIMLARPYRGLLALAGADPKLNIQDLDGPRLPLRALVSTGVRFIATKRHPRTDLPPLEPRRPPLEVYLVPNSAPRAAFFPETFVHRLDEAAIHRRLRDESVDLRRGVMVPSEAAPDDPPSPASGPATQPPPVRVDYQRPSTDVIELTVLAPQDGVLRVLEAYDVGWWATVDGRPVEIVAGDDMFLAVPLAEGAHAVRFEYRTPGATAGAVMAVLSLGGLLALWALASVRRSRPGSSPTASAGESSAAA